MKQVTVIIPNYNGIAYLENCLRSLAENDTALFDILVVDNASTDGSEAVAGKFEKVAQDAAAGKSDAVTGMSIRRLCLSTNTGFTGAVNAGIREADTPYVLLLNNDTTAAPDFVKRMLEAIERDGGIFSVSAKMLSMRQPEKLDDAGDCYCALGWAYGRGRGRSAAKPRYNKAAVVFAACGGAAIYRRDALEELGGFDGNHFAYLEDIDIGYRANLGGWRNLYEPSAVVWHAGSATSGSKHNAFKVSLAARNSVYLVYKNMPLLQLLLNAPFLLAGFLVKFLFFACKGLGAVYAKGLWQGLKLSASKEGRAGKVRFRIRAFASYLRVQWMLWGGMLQLLREF